MCAFRTSRDEQTNFEDMGKYVAGWTYPGKRNVSNLFSAQKIRSHYNNQTFSCTGQELITLVPVLLRYFQYVVLPRGRLVEHVKSLIACLGVVVLLMATRLFTVQPDELAAAIKVHLTYFRDVYGPNLMRPKHHYALHLPSMLFLFGLLLTTFVNERKHRIIQMYAHVRYNLQGFNVCALEDCTMHQLWELSLPFFNMYDSHQPRGRIFHALNALFPGVPNDKMTLHKKLKLHGGSSGTDDVVSYLHEGKFQVGQLKLVVGLDHGSGPLMFAIVTTWGVISESEDLSLRNFRVQNDVLKLNADQLDTIFTHRMSDGGDTCAIWVPYELRQRLAWVLE